MTSRTKSIKRNFILNFIFTVSGIVFPLLAFPYASRILLPEGTGKVAFVSSIVSYFTMIGMLGVPVYGIRACAKVRNDKKLLSKTVFEIFILNSITMLLSLLLYFITIVSLPRLSELKTLFYINSLTLILNLFGFDWLYKALEEYEFITKRTVLIKCFALILLFFLVKESTDYTEYSIILIMASTGSYVFNFLNLRKVIDFSNIGNLKFFHHLKPMFTFFIMAVATTIYSSLDAIMLGFISGDQSVGYYNAAINIKNVLLSMITSLGAVLLPRLSVYVQQQKFDEFRTLTLQALQFVVYTSIPLTFYFIIFAESSIYFLSGIAYYGSVLPMQVVMPTLFLVGISNLIGIQILVPLDKETVVVKSVCIGAVVNLLINVLLIPIFGAVGAAVGTLVAEIFVTAYQLYYLRTFLKDIIIQIKWKNILISTVLASILVYIFREVNNFESPLIVLILSSIIFGMIYGIVLILMKDDALILLVKGLKSKNEKL
ncbi:TPA: flippase [Streptococcus suis]|nr:flippase [Streptococcus suis]HEO8609015.1 flippase [Streptococcus suis]